MEHLESELDISWIQEQERLHKIHQNYSKERMESIDIFFIYINTNSYIEKIMCEKHSLDLLEKTSVLKKETVLQMIQSKKKYTDHSKYKLMDILVYNVDLEPQHIQHYSTSDHHPQSFFKVLPIVDDIPIPPSIFIFHNINSIFFLFQQHEMDPLKNPKSILKSSTSSANKVTKKVRITLNKTKSKKKSM